MLKAQEDIQKHTDIRFTFEELSDFGRRVERIAFTIHKNKQQADTESVEANQNQSENTIK